MNKLVAKFEIHDVFAITGKGAVLVGPILEGEFMNGDLLEFDFDGRIIERKIKGVDYGMRVQEGFDWVGVLIESLNQEEIDALRSWNPQKVAGKIYTLR